MPRLAAVAAAAAANHDCRGGIAPDWQPWRNQPGDPYTPSNIQRAAIPAISWVNTWLPQHQVSIRAKRCRSRQCIDFAPRGNFLLGLLASEHYPARRDLPTELGGNS